MRVEARPAVPLRHDSATASRKFLATDGVGDFELLEMERGGGPEAEFAAELLFQLDEHPFVLGAETVEHLGMNEDAELRLLVFALFAQLAEKFGNFSLDFHRHRQRAFDHAFAFAVGAVLVHRAGHALAVTLAGHLHEAELRDVEDAGLGLVATDAFAHLLRDLLLVVAVAHVDEVDDDEAADVAEAKLAADFLRGFEIGLQDRRVQVLLRFMATRVDVDCHERFCFIDADVAARLEPDLTAESVLDLFLDVEPAEDWRGFVVEPDLAAGAAADLPDHVADAFIGVLVVHHDAIHFLGQEIAHGALDQIGLLEDAIRRRLRLDFFLNRLPRLQQQFEVADEVALLLVFAHGADDDAHALGNAKALQDLFQALTFAVVFNLARDATLRVERHQHEVAAGDADVGGDPRALGADGAFDDLHDDFGARRIQLRDVLLRNLRLLRGALCFRCFEQVDALVELLGNDVPVMEEGVLLETDVDESRFQARLKVADLPLEHAGDDPRLGGALDGELLELALFEHGDAVLQRLGVDDDFLEDAFVAAPGQQFFALFQYLFDCVHAQ